MFSLFNFSSIFPGGQLTPFASVCGRPWPDGLEYRQRIGLSTLKSIVRRGSVVHLSAHPRQWNRSLLHQRSPDFLRHGVGGRWPGKVVFQFSPTPSERSARTSTSLSSGNWPGRTGHERCRAAVVGFHRDVISRGAATLLACWKRAGSVT